MISQDDIDTFEFYNRSDLTLSEYQNAAATTAIYPASVQILYPTLGLAGEAGEVADKVKKIIRDDKDTPEYRTEIAKEIGDVLWYCAVLADDLGYDLQQIADMNIWKLKERMASGKIRGDGDNR